MKKFIAILLLCLGFANANDLRCDSKDTILSLVPLPMLSADESKELIKQGFVINEEGGYIVALDDGFLSVFFDFDPNAITTIYNDFNLVKANEHHIICSVAQNTINRYDESTDYIDFELTFKVFKDYDGNLHAEYYRF